MCVVQTSVLVGSFAVVKAQPQEHALYQNLLVLHVLQQVHWKLELVLHNYCQLLTKCVL